MRTRAAYYKVWMENQQAKDGKYSSVA